jgi:hypothetical protein
MPENGNPTTEQVALDLERLQSRLGLRLPQSYFDFVTEYRPTRFPALIPDTWIHSKGFYPSEDVNVLSVGRPDILKMEEDTPSESPDHEYFVYGTAQRDVAVRTKYYRNSIVIAAYSQHELILLNPAVRTSDGEMEAILLYHSSVFRAPSFAELVRNISVAETTLVKHVPPYPQSSLKGTCADKLALTDIWW